ncbi:methyltransferase-like protein 7A [Dinothrombium tinctorium]|uniref:Methyltransferase-like protein 7A n=1 Tax=Dinothrombium tinctorium TaxID=1965070 RepID=A0A3S3PQL7_9ACAR|nr:methyltransferase-like protein 7A [Dinothrombium tinctorium]
MNRAVFLFNIYLSFLFCFTPILITIGFVLNLFPKLKAKFFASLQRLFEINSDNSLLESKRKKLFEPLKNLKSRDKNLRDEEAVRVLEFGIGHGSNLAYYPKNTRLIAIDVDPLVEEELLKNLKKCENVVLEKFIATSASDLSMLPFEFVDAVVCTHVFCCVDNQKLVAKEVKRVLVQGGKFYFLEHVGYRNKLYRFIQWLARPLWRLWFNNCRLGYRPKPILQSAGFADVSLDYFLCKEHHFLIRPNVAGIATKLV